MLRQTGAVALGALLAPEVLGGLGSISAPAASASTMALAKVSLQLCYLENVQFAGSLLALSKGYYTAQGLDVTVLPGGPNLAPEPSSSVVKPW